MIKKLIRMLLKSGHHRPHNGKPFYPKHSSDDFHKRGHYPNQHNQHGHGYYKKKWGSGSYSS